MANAITNPTNYVSIPKTIYASVNNTYGCSNVASVELQISNSNITSSPILKSCDTDGVLDGFYTFTLSDANAMILSGLPSGLVIEYYATVNDALLQTNNLPNQYKNTIPNQTTIYARIINGSDCYGIVPLQLIVNSNKPANFNPEIISLCDGNFKTLQVNTNFNSYLWNTGETSNSIKVTSGGNYSVTVKDQNSCEATKNFTVLISGIPTITSVEINDFQDNNNSITINATGLGEYEYSIDGIHFQDSPYFQNYYLDNIQFGQKIKTDVD